jgi:hypothetical protein
MRTRTLRPRTSASRAMEPGIQHSISIPDDLYFGGTVKFLVVHVVLLLLLFPMSRCVVV